MFVGDVNARSKPEVTKFRQLTYTCMENTGTSLPSLSVFESLKLEKYNLAPVSMTRVCSHNIVFFKGFD
jgi:hypothetical protein